ncbi:MAG: ABC transporter substrate-binding protein [Magnetococcales bacterium]|nr:ABC transporter substrate-binding protein [Magnetococcales bacterium]
MIPWESKSLLENSPGITRRRVLDWMARGGLATMLAGLPRLTRATDDEVVRIAYLPITDATPLLVAHALGFFAEQGLEVAPPVSFKGWDTLVRGFAEGHFNLVHLLKPIPVWMRYNNAFPVKIVSWAHTNGSAIVVGNESTIREFGDFSGKRMAIPYWYSMHNIVLQAGLRKVGIQPMVDQGEKVAAGVCALKVIPPPLMVKALANGTTDGYVVAEPFAAMGEMGGAGKVFRFTGDIWRDHPCCVVCMHESATRQKPQWTQKIMNAVVKGALHASDHREETARLLAKEGKGYLPVSADTVQRAISHYNPKDYSDPVAIRHQEAWHNQRIDFNPYPYPSATRMIVEMMNQTLVSDDHTFLTKITADFVAKDLVEYEFVQKALAEHPHWQSLHGVPSDHPFEREETLLV